MSLDARGALLNSSDFFGRADQLNGLMNAVGSLSPASTMVMGPRRCGKTWLLGRLRLELQRRPLEKVVTIWQDMAQVGPSSPQRFYRRLFAEIRRQAPDGLGELLDEPKEDPSEAFDQLNEFLYTLASSGYRTVFVMDEFERVAGNAAFDLHFFGQWRSIAEGASTAMILAAPIPLGELCHEGARGSPFWNVFNVLAVRPWSVEEIRDALCQWCRPDVSEEVAHGVLKATAGWPFAVKTLVNALPGGASSLSIVEIESAHGAFGQSLASDVYAALVEATRMDPLARPLFHKLCDAHTHAKPLTKREVPPGHALERWGLIRRDGGNVWPTWPGVVPVEMAPNDGWRADLLFAAGIPTHIELQRIATNALNTVTLNEAAKVIIEKMIKRLGHHNDDVFRDARDLKEILLKQLAPRVPELRGVTNPKLQMEKLQDIANGEAARRSPFDPVLARALWALHHAGNHGSHDPHRAWEPSDLEALSLVLLAIETGRREAVWLPPRKTSQV